MNKYLSFRYTSTGDNMDKKEKIFMISSTVIIFVINFLIHNVYKILPNDFTAIFFPVNESIYEHMKMLFTSYFIYSIILILFRKKYKANNILFTNLCGAVLNIVLFLIIYLPIYYRFGENMIVTLILLFLTILLTNYIIRFIYKKADSKELKIAGIILFPILFSLGAYFTFNPLEESFFFDPVEEIYGIPEKK